MVRAYNALVTTMPLEYRIGIGEDSHRLVAGGPLRLGGVDLPHAAHTSGHSDADVLLHAVTDALLGAAGLPDIGELFPNSDELNRGRDSAELLAIAWGEIAAAGWRVVNLDCVVAAEQPKISPRKKEIRERLAEVLGIEAGRVNVKAKTGEGLGPVGRGELIEARCVVLLSRMTASNASDT